MKEKIDAVVLWVDGTDIEWIKEKNRYLGKNIDNVDSSIVRYRDWGILRYWFRSIEKNVPWINKIFFVTNGQVPEWLNLKCDRLRFVKHSDYMPTEYLPTFSANPIEINLHRIEDLSENFIFFNDDMFALNPMSLNDFFINGLPVYPASLHCIVPLSGKSEEVMTRIYLNDVTLINRNFDIKEARRNWTKWLLPYKVGMSNAFSSLFCLLHNGYVGFSNHHLPVPMRKSTIREVWDKEYDVLHATSMNKFRSKEDVNQYVFRYWEMANQSFVPTNPKKLGEYHVINNDVVHLQNILLNCKSKMICLNDSDIDDACTDEDYEKIKSLLQSVFERMYSEKSQFEL